MRQNHCTRSVALDEFTEYAVRHPVERRKSRTWSILERKRQLKQLLAGSNLLDVICGKYISGRGVALFNEVCQRNLEGVVAKRKNGNYATISGWLKIKNPGYTQSQGRHELFESFQPREMRPKLPIPKKPPRARPLSLTSRKVRKSPKTNARRRPIKRATAG
jgi:hypothetical protein